ncbi:MAG: glycerophosphodiester phosphodiesterase [Deltaproteobacteria bacterium]|nr:glycerophosphodiester phosphodiesterase [Deltaproteobacteria bacterium]
MAIKTWRSGIVHIKITGGCFVSFFFVMSLIYGLSGGCSNMKDTEKRHFYKIAHRGASAYEPENTLRSFKRAIEIGAEMMEFDVRFSQDGHLVIIHDKKVDRTTNGHGLVREMTLSELKKLDAGKGEKIPTLEEVFDFGKGTIKFVVELKDRGTEEKVINLVRDKGLIDDVFLVSFHCDLIKRAKSLEPRIRTGLIMLFSFDTVGKGKECRADAVAPSQYFITRGMVEKVNKNGMFLFAWTVDDPKKAKKLKEIGVDGIVTNKPDLL